MSKIKGNKRHLWLAILFVALNIFSPALSNEDEMNAQSPFGVLEFLHWNHPWNDYKYSCIEDVHKVLELMKEAGVAWVRMDFLWDEIEPVPGEFAFEKYDGLVEILREHNIHILGILDYSAAWAAACAEWNCPPKEPRTFVNYATAVISRYNDQIKYWEVWNEPDSRTYWSEQDGLKSYCALLKEVYIAAKKIDPDCKILNGGLANAPATINHLYANGAKDYFDILNIHIFESPLNAGSIRAVSARVKMAKKIMDRNDDRQKQIWVTEIGCPGVKGVRHVESWWMGRNPTERQQAKWLSTVYDELLKDKRVEKVFWAFFRDCKDHWANGVDYFGIVRWDYSRKAAFWAFQDCVNNWKKRAACVPAF